MDNRVAIYGGGFDPTTLGHIAVASVVHEQTNMPIWMMPCYGHKFGKVLTEAHHRLKMIELVSETRKFIVPFPYEIYVKHTGSMYETLCRLSVVHPDKRFYLVMGMDNANLIQEWDQWEKLIAEYPCLIVRRLNYPIKSEWWLEKPHNFLNLEVAMSATDFRQAIAEGNYEWAQKSVSPEVWQYIVENSLLGYKEKP
jgi:nicotinate-nucleotide adenylyltransferase